eukprot:TRINITY_DN66160_c0_g1_i1.p1 TRINITY_DN66160_c0_g1~~TRINITY_DN66160_c0_g1_i1.p1  ORF type:complete len:154 (-),score=39.43 TRINITY_DN66160_c0_g1_i1:99-560(-)
MAIPCHLRFFLLFFVAKASRVSHRSTEAVAKRTSGTKVLEEGSAIDFNSVEKRGCNWESKIACKAALCNWYKGICWTNSELAHEKQREIAEDKKKREEAEKEEQRNARAAERRRKCDELIAQYLKENKRSYMSAGDYNDGFKKYPGAKSVCNF